MLEALWFPIFFTLVVLELALPGTILNAMNVIIVPTICGLFGWFVF
jgi:hypothetical protein